MSPDTLESIRERALESENELLLTLYREILDLRAEVADYRNYLHDKYGDIIQYTSPSKQGWFHTVMARTEQLLDYD